MISDFLGHFHLPKERNNKGSKQAQLTNVQNQIWLDPTTYRSQNHAKNFLKLKILGRDYSQKMFPIQKN